MPRPAIDFEASTRELLQSVGDLPPESDSPLRHFRRSASDTYNLVEYVKRNVSRANHYPAAFERHLGRLQGMALERLIGAFERFLKELAAICIEHLADFALDGRLDKFTAAGSAAAAHFEAKTVGRALSESDTWLSCSTINDRFRRLLGEPFDAGGPPFNLFPAKNQQPDTESWRLPIMATLFQVRHTLVHNLGVLTHSDAAKLRQLSRSVVPSGKILSPSNTDLRRVQRFLSETAASVNTRVAKRLGYLLTKLHEDKYIVFDPPQKAQTLANAFDDEVSVCGERRSPMSSESTSNTLAPSP